ncbi:MAG: hypothetical protein LAN61_08715 [Acidobacteriia bacterium]|nr:hypothetical protein [Terriglobia bacterium]
MALRNKAFTFAALAILFTALAPAAHAQLGPCCMITAIDARTATVTAKINPSGATFEFRVTNPLLLRGLRPGQSVYANFKAKQVSLDGKTACCAITAGPTAGPVAGTAPVAGWGGPNSLAGGRPGKLPSAPAQMGPIVPALGCPAGPAAPDLMITALGFDPARHVTYTVANCGQATTQQPFIVDLYLKADRGDTVEHQPLPARSQQTVTSQLAQYRGCDRVQLRAVADPQHIVSEANENNNERTLDIVPPCPDLVVQEIKQDWEDANTRYLVQIKVGNTGNGPSQVPVYARVVVFASGVSIPQQENQEIPPLAPGQSFIFHPQGKHLATSTTEIDIFVDFFKQLMEANEENNIAHKTLGPH